MAGRPAAGQRARRRALTLVVALCATAAFAGPARAETVVSLTFDDGHASQHAVKDTLASHGMRGTFYVNSAKVGTSSYYMTWAQVDAIAAGGNEIAGHTLTHVNLTGTAVSEAEKRRQVCEDRQNLIARGYDPVTFAYPYGAVDAVAESIVRDCGYRAARRTGGIVSPNWCPSCWSPRAESLPPANPFAVRTPSFGSGEITLAAIQDVVMQAELGGGWVPLVFHGVCESACTEGWVRPSTLTALMDWLAPRAAHGTVVRTVRQALEPAAPPPPGVDTSIESKPPGLSVDKEASFTFSSDTAGATFECALDTEAFAACASPVSYANLSVGQHTFRVRARDGIGNVDATPATWLWEIKAPSAPTTVSLTFDDGQRTQYSVRQILSDHGMHGTFYVNSGWVCTADCDGAFTMTWPQLEALAADGNEIGGHTLEHVDLTSTMVSAAEKRRQVCEDRENLVARGFDPVSFAYPYGDHDIAAETIVSECGYSSARTGDNAPVGGETIPPANRFATRTPPLSTGEITLAEMQNAVRQAENVGGGWVQLAFHGFCDTRCNDGWVKPSTFDALLDWLEPRATAYGTVVKTVREVMDAETPAVPDTSITGGPDGTTGSDAASFEFSSDRAIASFECKLDAGDWAPCASPSAYSGLADGSHTFSVRAKEGTSVDPSPATRTWTIDTAAPDTSITTGPSGTVGTATASFAFTATETDSTFECQLDEAEWAACGSPTAYSGLADGVHTFAVRAIDRNGNVDASPALRAWTVDLTAPETSVTAGPSGWVNTTSASFAFTASETGSFECKLDAGAWGACTSPKSYSGLANGSHTFSVRAKDGVGNVDASPATRTWTVDTVAPNTSITSGPSGNMNSSSATFSFTATETGATFECRLDAALWSACTSPRTYTGISIGSHTFYVRARDAAGNVDGSPASRSFKRRR